MNNLLIKSQRFKSLSEMFRISQYKSIIAGPCSVESSDQVEIVAQNLVHNNIKFIRGGAFKPRTSPYNFQGLGIEGLKILYSISKKYSLISVSEIMDIRDIETGLQYIDIIQVGSRNMTNYPLLKELGQTRNPILLKRGMMSTLNEFFLAAEYIVSNGNENLVLCERGIRTFENSTRNTLDISSVAIIKQETSLPVIIDLSHSLGRKDILLPISKAVLQLDIDGIMVEVHNSPATALSDRQQQLSIEEFQEYCDKLSPYMKANQNLNSKE